MIDLYYWTTPNGHKITIFLEETGLHYKIIPVNIGKGEQFKPEFLAVSPNNRIPAIVDHEPADGGKPISVFESGAILLYLAEKTGKFFGKDLRGRVETLEWLFWQMGGLGPMAGQNNHFSAYAPEKIPYAIDRYRNEVNRLYGVMNKSWPIAQYLAGEYSIADMACYPWVVPWERQGPEHRRLPPCQALAGSDQGAARGGQGLRMDAEDQSRSGRRSHPRRTRHPVWSDRELGSKAVTNTRGRWAKPRGAKPKQCPMRSAGHRDFCILPTLHSQFCRTMTWVPIGVRS